MGLGSLLVNSLSFRGGSRTAATSKMEHFVIIVNGWKPLTIITKRSILDVATVLDPPLSFFVCDVTAISQKYIGISFFLKLEYLF